MKRTKVEVLQATDAELMQERVEDGREWGRKAILAGWIITMIGVVGYVFAMLRADEQSGLLEALFSQGFLGWASAVLLLGGIATWLAGNLAFFRAAIDEPRDEGDEL
jgi:hypothetical protein